MLVHGIKAKSSLLVMTIMLAACAEGGGFASMDTIKERYQTAKAAKEKEQLAATPPKEIVGLFKRHPITNSRNPETWPRVAITITGGTKGVFEMIGLGTTPSVKTDDCITYSLKVWTSAAQGKSYPGLKMCADEVYERAKGIPLYQIQIWGVRQFFPNEKTTGSVRTEGPTPPLDHFPSDPALQRRWLDSTNNSSGFLGGVLVMLGYNWNDTQDKRVWVVNVPPGPVN